MKGPIIKPSLTSLARSLSMMECKRGGWTDGGEGGGGGGYG